MHVTSRPRSFLEAGFRPLCPLLFILYNYLEQNLHFGLVPEPPQVPSARSFLVAGFDTLNIPRSFSCGCIHTCIHVYIHTERGSSMFTYICEHMHTHMLVYMHWCVYTCIRAYAFMYRYMNKDTHIYMYRERENPMMMACITFDSTLVWESM